MNVYVKYIERVFKKGLESKNTNMTVNYPWEGEEDRRRGGINLNVILILHIFICIIVVQFEKQKANK